MTSPLVARRRAARQIREMRHESGLNLDEAASRLDLTRSALHRLESGVSQINVHVVRSMMDLYDQYMPDLLDTVRAARQRGWWRHYSIANREYLGWESGASHLREMATLRLPDLLQTADSALAVRQLTSSRADEVEARRIRQRRLVDPDDPLAFTAVIDESALRSQPCDASALRHLIEIAALPTVDIHVLPYSAGARSSGFRVLSFARPDDLPVAFVDHLDDRVRVDDPPRVAAAERIFDDILSVALCPEESVEFTRRVAAEQRRVGVPNETRSA